MLVITSFVYVILLTGRCQLILSAMSWMSTTSCLIQLSLS